MVKPPRDDLLIMKDLGLIRLFSNQQKKGICQMDRIDWVTMWKEFHAWYRLIVKNTGHSPTWRRQQNKIHKLITRKIVARKSAPTFTGKRPVGRPRKYPLAQPAAFTPGPSRMVEANREPLPTIESPGM